MRIGVVSDTHNQLGNVRRIVELFNASRVERVVHTGDVTQAKTLAAFSDLVAPLSGVFGNNDECDELRATATRHGFDFSEGPREHDWAGVSILVAHDPLELTPAARPHHRVLLHGHTHRQRIEREGERLVFNPGECAGHMRGLNAVGVLDLITLETEILHF